MVAAHLEADEGEKRGAKAIERREGAPYQTDATLRKPGGDEHPDLLHKEARDATQEEDNDDLVEAQVHLIEVRFDRVMLGPGDRGSALGGGLVVETFEVTLGGLLSRLLGLVRLSDFRRVELPALTQPIGKVANDADKSLNDKGNEEKREKAEDHGASPFGLSEPMQPRGAQPRPLAYDTARDIVPEILSRDNVASTCGV